MYVLQYILVSIIPELIINQATISVISSFLMVETCWNVVYRKSASNVYPRVNIHITIELHEITTQNSRGLRAMGTRIPLMNKMGIPREAAAPGQVPGKNPRFLENGGLDDGHFGDDTKQKKKWKT